MTDKQRPDVLPAEVTKMPTGLGTLYIIITELDGKPFEVFAVIGKNGGDVQAKAEVTGRLISLALRHDIPVEKIVKQLIDISGENTINYKKELIKSIPDAIGKVLRNKYLIKGGRVNGT